MSQLLKVNPSPFAFDPMHAFLPSLELHSLRCPLSFLYFSIFLSHIDSFPSACKPTQCLSHPNESSLDLRSPGNLISFLMSLKLLQSSLYSSSPPAHLPPTPPSLQPDSTSSPLYRHSWEKIFYDFKLPNLTDIFSVLISLNLSAIFDSVYYSLILAALFFFFFWMNSPYISDYSFSFSFILSTFPLNVNNPLGSFFGLCASHLACSP